MASSRIFIKGLPPLITEDDFRKHFAIKGVVTDAKLIPQRRIGYVGYKSSDEAAKAVKYFNKTFIRMSRIAVEIARPISDAELPLSRKTQRENAREAQRLEREAADAEQLRSTTLKRKRVEVDESDEKLKEFLDVMQPASKPRTRSEADKHDPTMNAPPAKMQAIDLVDGDSDHEYEAVPKKRVAEPVQLIDTTQAPEILQTPQSLETAPSPDSKDTFDTKEVEATDDDWLRSRTSRVLDLVDPDQATILPSTTVPPETALPRPTHASRKAQVQDQQSLSVPESNLQQAEIDVREAEEPAEAVNVVSDTDATIDAIKLTGRLFVRNLPYTATEHDLRESFGTFGELEEVHLPLDSAGSSKGFALIQFVDPPTAAHAFHNLDGEPFQGRLLHILPAAIKRQNKLDEFAIAKLPLKKQKEIKRKADASSTTFNWNSLYMNQDAVNSSIADRLGITKAELLDPTSADAGVKQAIAETSIIQETKVYFANNGVDLNAFKRKERGDTTMLVKNFPYGMSLDDLRKMFEEFGQVLRVLMPSSGTIAIVEFAQPPQARAAFANLSYRRIKDSVLFLEKAPKDLFTSPGAGQAVGPTTPSVTAVDPKQSTSDLLDQRSAAEAVDTTTLFVRNLNFETTNQRLADLFRPLDGFMSARVNTKPDPKKPGQILSMGFGFLEFRSKTQAQAALAAMDGHSLDGHKLSIKASHKALDAAEERRKEDRAKKQAGRQTKIIIKNLPFEASKKDVRALFGTYGQLRSVRVPKKFDNSARGFAFAEFITAREAENALEALKDTHLLGRRLVLEFASEDLLDADAEIEKMQKKVGKQVNKVALQSLVSGGRKKFNIEGNEDDVL